MTKQKWIKDKMYDYLIIGGGISGCTLYNRLKYYDINSGEKLNNISSVKVKLIDNSPISSSSKVAAGLYNPIVFKRLSKSWEVDKLLPEMDDFYSYMEIKFNTKFLHKTNIAKILSNQDEVNFWLKKSKEIETVNYLSDNIISYKSHLIENSAGLAIIKNSGFLDINNYINHTIQYANENEEYLVEKFDFSNLEIGDNISYKTSANHLIQAKNIIFAEGYQVATNNIPSNPFFPNVNFKLTKGEVLTIQINDKIDGNKNDFDLDYVINKNVFLMPLKNVVSYDGNQKSDKQYKVGATYEWDDLTEIPTSKGKNDIINKFEVFFKGKYQILEHKVGIRPTVIDRRPIIGSSSNYNNVYIFNGLGTKGVMIVPLISKVFISNYLSENENIKSLKLLNDKSLNEINYNRFLR